MKILGSLLIMYSNFYNIWMSWFTKFTSSGTKRHILGFKCIDTKIHLYMESYLPLIHGKPERENVDRTRRTCGSQQIRKLRCRPKWEGIYCWLICPPSETIRLQNKHEGTAKILFLDNLLLFGWHVAPRKVFIYWLVKGRKFSVQQETTNLIVDQNRNELVIPSLNFTDPYERK